MNIQGLPLTLLYTGMALVIALVFVYRIRQGTFQKHIMAEAAIVVSYVVVAIAGGSMPLAARLVTPLAVAALFMYGRRKSGNGG
jgi:low temperature requirement protein LtrA